MNQQGIIDTTQTGCIYIDCKSNYSTREFCTNDDGKGCIPCRRLYVIEVVEGDTE